MPVERFGVVDDLDDLPRIGGDRGQPSHPDIDADGRGRPGGLVMTLRPDHSDTQGDEDAVAAATHGHCQHPRPTQSDEPVQPAGVLTQPDDPDLRDADVAAIDKPETAGGDRVAVLVTAPFLEPGKADAATGELALAGLLPPPVRVNAVFDAV